MPISIPRLVWNGDVPHQKWMNFYTKVLSKFAATAPQGSAMHLFRDRIMIGQLQFLRRDPFRGGDFHSKRHFISQLKKIGRARKHDFIVIDTPGGVQHLSLIAHGMADTLITPINDSLVDLDVLVAMEQSDLEPQPSVYAKTVWRALEARLPKIICGRKLSFGSTSRYKRTLLVGRTVHG
jgi:hypothetical protein